MIGFVGRFVRTRVSRRLFVLFVLSAFLPLALIAVLSLSQVRSLLLEQGEQRLAAVAKTYGMTLFERLLLASDVAAAAAGNPAAAAGAGSMAARTFSALAEIAPDRTTALIGEPPKVDLGAEARQRLAAGQPWVAITGEGAGVRVVIAIGLAQRPASVVVGELREEALWGLADEFPSATGFCVLEDEEPRRVLYCSEPMPREILRSLRVQGRSGFASAQWTRDGQATRARAWSQFLRAGFGTPDWMVVASQPESHQLARLTEFTNVYLPVVALTLLLVAWLTVRQTRDIAGPVGLLAERTRGIANNDFTSRLDLERDDELGELANAVDQMSQRLGNQFSALTALAEIDHLILATQDIAQVVRIVLQRMQAAVPAQAVAITLFDQDNPDQARTFFQPPEAPGTMSLERHAVTPADRFLLQGMSEGTWLDSRAASIAPSFLANVLSAGAPAAYLQPIVWRGVACGVLSLAYRDAAQLTEGEKQEARELADRIAVAVGSQWRDEQLYQQSHFDPLTGMPNRLLFKDRVEREIARGQRESTSFALLFVDLDHFKHVNDSFGHTAGDKVLLEASRRVSRCIRDSDTVARLGGDEFTVMLGRLNHPQEAWVIAESVVAALSEEFNLGEQQCFVSASVGIASFPADGGSAEELLKSADTAMYRAKAAGRGQVVFFEEKMNREAVARVTLDRDLRVAIDRNELVLHYQPQVDVASGRIRGAEALVRWNHPKHGLVSPSRFIPLAEESGFIEQIGRWIIERACAQMKEWRALGLPLERISVNVSPRQFRRRGLEDFIRRAVESCGLPAACIEFEITEGLLLERGEAVEGPLLELDRMGHRIALDDFGTGFSSMTYLQRFPVHTVKIDRVFVEGLGRSADSQAIVAAIIAMSHALGKLVIAEGVETDEQLALLKKLRCDEIQGFLVSPALPPEAFAQFIGSRVEAATPI